MAANAIVHSCGSELIPVRLLSPRNISVKLRKGQQIAKMEGAESCTSTTGFSTISVGTELQWCWKEIIVGAEEGAGGGHPSHPARGYGGAL